MLIVLLMLPNLIWLGYSHSLSTWIEALVLPATLLTVVFALLGRWPWVACLLLAPFALLAPLEAFYVATYQTPSSAQIIATLITTNGPEVHQYLGRILPLALALPLICFGMALFAAWLAFLAGLRWRGRVREWLVAIAIVTPLLSVLVAFIAAPGSMASRAQVAMRPLQGVGSSLRHGFPFGVIQRIATFRQEWSAMRQDARRLKDFSFHATRTEQQPHQRQVYVLVIGESDTRTHWQLFGYPRATNPELVTLPNIIPVTRMVTSWAVTVASVPVILTRKPITSSAPQWKEPSFLPAMREAGYETWWISNQYPIGKFDSPIAVYAYEAQHVVWVNHTVYWDNPGAYDGAIIPALKRALSSSNRDMFIVLHLMGSHFQYDYRYPPAFATFKPVQFDDKSAIPRDERIRNSYDNSIRYTDHVLAQVIDTLKQTGAVSALWFESDHGDVLPTPACDQQGHGIGTWHEFEIPAFFWYSDAYSRAYPERVATLRSNATKRTMTGDTFATMLGMAGVDFPGLDQSWNLFSPAWHYRTRWVSQLWRTNFDDSVFGKACGVVMPADPDSVSD
ncbi:MAG TPA: phosphoethanolamine transferase [Rhodanobacteraceae bacterium]|nr:phosphoethanolamine transferase [Rhodanobacteraceae bacterium]